jgi:hypothetical protein
MIDAECDRPRVLLFSQRNIFEGALFRCPHYEFEDIITQIDSVDIVAPQAGKWFKYTSKVANQVVYDANIGLNPGLRKSKLAKEYDLLFAVFSFPNDVLNLNTLTNWKDHCKTSICLIDELWVYRLVKFKGFFRFLSQFDHVLLYYSQSVKAVAEMLGTKCSFMPPGVDASLFCPYPQAPKRFIDVYSMGRRSQITHQALLRLTKETGRFYVYDTLIAAGAMSARDHRFLVANMAKRSQYFLVYPGLIDRPDIRGDQIEIGNRYFEAAAAGTIMIGEAPRNGEFEKLFNWPNAVSYLPFDSDNVRVIIEELDKDSDKREKIRRHGILQSLLRHDWLYRWETVLDTAGLEPLKKHLKRKQHLHDLARMVEGSHIELPCHL